MKEYNICVCGGWIDPVDHQEMDEFNDCVNKGWADHQEMDGLLEGDTHRRRQLCPRLWGLHGPVTEGVCVCVYVCVCVCVCVCNMKVCLWMGVFVRAHFLLKQF